jgi:hypothetical protein
MLIKVKEKIIFISICISMLSCNSIKFISLAKTLDKKEVEKDVRYLKSKLLEKHYNLNWENREAEIISRLDSLVIDNSDSELTIERFSENLKEIIQTIDDGHTNVFGFNIDNKRITKNVAQNFSCITVDTSTVLIRVPNFTDEKNLKRNLKTLKLLLGNGDCKRIIVDLRTNKGGDVLNVACFLNKILEDDTSLCLSQKVKAKKGLLGVGKNLTLRLKGLIRSGDFFEKKCQKIKGENIYNISKKYVLIDSGIISGSMLATYHLRKAGYIVVGENPNSLFNTFGNAEFINLPSSNLYVSISTARAIVDQNYKKRDDDKLTCDLVLKEQSLGGIIKAIKLYEK